MAGAMALFGVLRRHSPHHDALLGPWSEWLDVLDMKPSEEINLAEPTAPEQEVIDLNAVDFDLLTYLVCAHHGKVRMTWHASPLDYKVNNPTPSIRGVREGDKLPPLHIAAADGKFCLVPEITLTLSPSEMGLHPRTGRSWIERVLNLVEQKGLFTVAWLEAIIRTADWRASDMTVQDTLLVSEVTGQNAADVCIESTSSDTVDHMISSDEESIDPLLERLK